METLGSAEEIRNVECLEYLPSSECDRLWRFTPSDSEDDYLVSLPSTGPGEFVVSVYRR